MPNFMTNRSRDMAIFQFIKTAAFLKVQNVTCRFGSEGQYVSQCHISYTVAEIWPIFDFPKWRRTANLDI